MKIYIVLILLSIFPVLVFAQQTDDDPFKRDPFFNKSLDEFFGSSIDDEEDEPQKTESADVLTRLSNRGIDLSGGFEAGPYYSNPLYSQFPNLSALHFNRVNGLFFGIKRERMQWYRSHDFLGIPRFQPHGYIGYGTASKEWEYAAGLERLFGHKKRLMIGAEFHKATATEDYWRAGLIETSLTSLVAGYDYLDYYKMEGYGAYAVYRSNRWLEAALSYNSDTYNSAGLNTRYSLFGFADTYRPNPPVDSFSDEIDLDRFNMSFSFNPRRVLLANQFTFSASAGAELADNPGSDDAYRYNKFWSDLYLFYNFEPGSVLNWRIKTGSITGNAPDFKQFYTGGIGSLRGSPYKVFSGNQMVLSNLEVQFGSPSKNNGSWYREYNIHLLLFLDSAWTNFASDLTEEGASPFSGSENFSFSDFQHDAGFGLGTDAFRFEVAWPLKTFDSRPMLWLRLNPTF
ncbi:MAG: hypothetical protein WEA56_10510 [Balneolaceae bacterium]